MLTELRIRNLAVIDSVTLPFSGGFNVLTGETGAGKSIIVGALSFLLGDRASADRIRDGFDKAFVEGVFAIAEQDSLSELLNEYGIDLDNELLILKREISSTGRSRAWVNGSSVTVSVLADVGNRLVTICGQHEARQLIDPDRQRELLDSFAGSTSIAKSVSDVFAENARVKRELQLLVSEKREAAKQEEFYSFQLREIEDAQLRDGEDETIDAEMDRLTHAEELQTNADESLRLLSGGDSSVQSLLGVLRRKLTSMARIDGSAERLFATLDSIMLSVDELSRDVSTYRESVDVDPARLRMLESRRHELSQLLRKYGPSVSDAIATALELRERLSLTGGFEDQIAQLTERQREIESSLRDFSLELTRLRSLAAQRLSKEVTALLPELGMAHAEFDVVLESLGEVSATGAESVQFVASLNGGATPRALNRIASGGELSRVMLALTTVLARVRMVPVLVFDEIDAGIGGNVAWQVGALMQRLADNHQVMAISHLAQIAAQAHSHVGVRKGAVAGVTSADTTLLLNEERVLEIARMLGGDADREVSRAHARELLARGAV